MEELQKLCDVHSALFHERTTKMDSMEKLTEVVGHPLYTLTRENDALEELLSKAKVEIQKEKSRTVSFLNFEVLLSTMQRREIYSILC